METLVTIGHGQLRGTTDAGVRRFMGIPYAADPVGSLRFKAPQPPAPWEGVRDCTRFGATPPHPGYRSPFDQILGDARIDGDDWLTVNVWAPEGGESLPVMVWIHGGAFVNGSSAIPAYDGHNFARDGVVLVTINYRLGVDGFGWIEDAPPNRGLLDQVAALRWVRQNIASFGGDPSNVTVFGESAGAMSIVSLLRTPSARGLFAKAIAQSGATQAEADPADAARVTTELGLVLGIEPTLANLAAVEIEDLTAAQRTVSDALTTDADPNRWGSTIAKATMAWIPAVDGEVLGTEPRGADVPLLIGTTTDEWRFFYVPLGIAAGLPEAGLAGIVASRGIPAAAVKVYRANRPTGTPGDVLCALLTDAFFRLPAIRVAEAHKSAGARVWVYEFAQPSAIAGMGACHAVEISYVFDNLGLGGKLVGDDAPQRLADSIHATWVDFARTGAAGWPEYDDSRLVKVFDGPADRVVSDPRGDERAAWEV